MPYVHCSHCMHEWETACDLDEVHKEKCDWCKKGVGILLEEKTPLERMLNNITFDLEALDEVLDPRKKQNS